MEDEMTVEELARAWAALDEWRWDPGLTTLVDDLLWLGEDDGGNTYVDGGVVGPDGRLKYNSGEWADFIVEMLPNVTSPMAVGWMRHLAQGRHPGVSTVRVPGGWQLMQPWPFGRDLHTHGRWGPVCKLEAECYRYAVTNEAP